MSKETLKVKQVSISIDPVGKYFILAVAEDGTLWQLEDLYEGKPTWRSFPSPTRHIEDRHIEDLVIP